MNPEEANMDASSEEAVAVIGMAGRFPGARDVGELWQKLRAGVELVTTFTDAELEGAGVSAALRGDARYVRRGGALDEADAFDAGLFGVTPREAELMDPQHRAFLECAWAALEDAAHDPSRFSGRIGVFAGSGFPSYLLSHLLHTLPLDADPYQLMIQNGGDFLTTRVSHKLNLTGPSVTVQTACSTSLVAIHLACQSLLAGECDMALAGGVSIRFPMRAGYLHQQFGILSSDGHCRPFDARGSGTVLGNGVGVVVLRRASDALAARDRTVALVKGSAVNNDGSHKAGYTAPSAEGQARVVAEAQLLANAPADSIGYVEAHGTGTAIGDPIEVSGLVQAFGATSRRHFCALGSVKSNIGHLDAAAGVAGFIKATLALANREIPPSLHFEEPNPEIDWSNTPFFVPKTLVPWGANGARRRAGVSSFGIGGTNAHVVLEEAEPPVTTPSQRTAHLLVLSAATEEALRRSATNLAEALERGPALAGPGAQPTRALADVAFTLQQGRRALLYRRAVVARDVPEAIAKLRTVDAESAKVEGELEVAFLFPGQGTQHLEMGRALYAAEPVFRDCVDECARRLAEPLGFDLRAIVHSPEALSLAGDSLDDTRIAQPALFMIEYALAQLWQSWGIRPRAMLGHSVGEWVAACIAGVLDLPTALALVAERGRLMQSLPRGSMLAVSLAEADVAPMLTPELTIAAVNGPQRSVVAGPTEAIEALERSLAERGVARRRLVTSHAFHSPMMDPILEAFRQRVAAVRLSPPRIPFVSNLTGTWITDEQARSPDYWARHLREPVRFVDGLGALAHRGTRVLLEVGPGDALTRLARRGPASFVAIASLPGATEPRGVDDARALEALGRLFVLGADVSWSALYAGEGRTRVALPTYPFERTRYWYGDGSALRPDVPRQHQPAPTQAARPPLSAPFVAPRTENERALAAIFQDLFGVASVGVNDDFNELGGDSLLAVQLLSRIHATLCPSFRIDALMDVGARTVAQLARHIDETDAPATDASSVANAPHQASLLVEMQRGEGELPVFCLPGVGGTVFEFAAFARHLGPAHPVYGLVARGLSDGEEPEASVEATAASYLEEVRRKQPKGPYAFVGMSFGGVVGLEIAQRLIADGEEVALLAALDSPIMGTLPRPMNDDAELFYYLSGDKPELHPDRLRALDPAVQDEVFLAHLRGHATESFPDVEVSTAQLHRFLKVWKANMGAIHRYVPRPYEGGPITFFWATERDAYNVEHPEHGWLPLAIRGLHVRSVASSHRAMLNATHVGPIAEYVRDLLAARKAPIRASAGAGFPAPRPKTFAREHGPWTAAPLSNMAVLVSGAVGAELVASATKAVTAMGAKAAHEDDAGNVHAIVFDASSIDDPRGLGVLHTFFHQRLDRIAPSGRIVVLTRDGGDRAPASAAAAAAVEGFVRSVAKEIGRTGATANLVRVGRSAEKRLPALLHFLLSARSAFVTAQPIDLSMLAQGEPAMSLVKPLAGKVALVTGAARGIGEATARMLAQEGAHVVCVGRPSDDARLRGLAEAIRGLPLFVDLHSVDAPTLVADALRRLGGVDILVHNAGVARDALLAGMRRELWDEVLDVNLDAILRTTTPLEDDLLHDGGRIVCLSSVAGIAGNATRTSYAAAKAGVLGWVRALAPRLANRGVTVNAVAPGFIETRMTEGIPQALQEAVRRDSALGQSGLPEDVANAIVFLASPGAQGITGATLRVCGGLSVGA